MDKREKQFRQNLDYLLGGHENWSIDEDKDPRMTWDNWVKYVFPEVYHIKANGGLTQFGHNICGNLKFLGRRKLEEILYEEVVNEGWLLNE